MSETELKAFPLFCLKCGKEMRKGYLFSSKDEMRGHSADTIESERPIAEKTL